MKRYDHWEGCLIGKTNAATVFRRIEEDLWEHRAVGFTSVPGMIMKRVLRDSIFKHMEGKK